MKVSINITSVFILTLISYILLVSCSTLLADVKSDDSTLPKEFTLSPLNVTPEVVATGFRIPWAIAVLGEEEYLISERMGRLYYFMNGENISLLGVPETRTFHDSVSGLTYGGLMDVSLHPNFSNNRLVYITYVSGLQQMAVARFNFQDRSIENLEVIFKTNAFSIGSRIAWEDENHFFVTHGMARVPRPGPEAQDLSIDSGKIHRLMADGSIPTDNPIFAQGSSPTSIWSYGHRNPQGLLFSKGILYAHEHGPLAGDEFNIIEKGKNYGWPLFSYGFNYDGTPVSNMTEDKARAISILPLKAWPNDNIAPSGLIRLENSAFPDLDGSFLFGSLVRRQLLAYEPDTDQTLILIENAGRVRDVAQLPSGKLIILIDSTRIAKRDGQVIVLSPN